MIERIEFSGDHLSGFSDSPSVMSVTLMSGRTYTPIMHGVSYDSYGPDETVRQYGYRLRRAAKALSRQFEDALIGKLVNMGHCIR